MHILAHLIFSSLLCTPLLAMDVPQKTGEPENASTTSRLQKLFATAQHVYTAEGTAGGCGIEELRWNPQGTLLAAAVFGEDPFILNPHDDCALFIPVSQHQKNGLNWVRHLAWNKDGKRIAFACKSQKIFIWDMEENRITHIIPSTSSSFIAPTVAWSPIEENTLVCCRDNESLTKYQIPRDSAGDVSRLSTISFRELSPGYPTRLDWRNETVAMAYREAALYMKDGTITPIPAKNNASCHSRAIACHPFKNRIACAFDGLKNPRIVLCEPEGEALKIIATKDLAENYIISDISFSHDGSFLTMPLGKKTIVTLDAETLDILHTHPLGKDVQCCENVQWNPQKTQLAFADARKLFITAESETPEEK